MTPTIASIADELLARSDGKDRFIVALAGPPGAGKSFRSAWLARQLNERLPGIAEVVPMDGYHYDNAVLEPMGLLALKGAPETFDVEGLRHDLTRLKRADRPVAVPVFDRPLDLARAGARVITPHHRLLIVEGNYLLLDHGPWQALQDFFDFSLFLEVDDSELERRLIERWIGMGQDPSGAIAKARDKDMLNARLIKTRSRRADLYWH
ncbi:nucleoside triphosphate hydrolase [Halomonas denitrificans]|uniref:nucleoside triphosphate hydrolase n=1 Tax=Halomonas TaxID=2745 RepID=UPI001C984C5D|nr:MULTISPECIES: nucleoside triphosphate hydrolase [Halomonas]MED5294672.1 nucleoside triphosphate hydrolase [Pseudomonadota bacterium]MBY5924863.1 nucleoside triphosphate hydrolase [Halomonas sp. DP4Y7-2]MBY5929410.1 nucleoside triphosphate hydrolase [Halomonas sp. DP8Y7-3]MBY5968812.1 nucleoside triphosphate hydrolase [Halomonas denitrificans]MBY5983810.1 nucleoside triphosphate hydrolase [Halomonas sp. DP5Y7-2]